MGDHVVSIVLGDVFGGSLLWIFLSSSRLALVAVTETLWFEGLNSMLHAKDVQVRKSRD